MSRTVLAVAVLLAIAAVACVTPIVAPVLVVESPAPFDRHDIGAWPDDDEVCVQVPTSQAIYVSRQCLPMRAVRWLILTARVADEDPHEGR